MRLQGLFTSMYLTNLNIILLIKTLNEIVSRFKYAKSDIDIEKTNENMRIVRPFFWDVPRDILGNIFGDILRDILRDIQNQHQTD